MNELLDRIIREDLSRVARQKGRILFMPGDGRYQPEELKPFLGYDMWATFLIIVEWFWLLTLAKIGEMPERDAKFLTYERLMRLLFCITTTRQDAIEKETKHDILALLQLMRLYLPRSLHRWLHLGATSYDKICTAYALILQQVFIRIFWPKLQNLDLNWREKIRQYVKIVQAGRTHLQTALPVTIGFWLACLHHRFIDSARRAFHLVTLVPGKFSGAVGTSAAIRTMLPKIDAEGELMKMLGLKPAKFSTQITPSEASARFYFEMVLMSGVLGNFGEDIRILQSSMCGELTSAASSSSTMAHKKANPIVAENVCGMHVDVIAEFMKVLLTLVSDLQRDLRWSSVMRSFSAIMTYGFNQITSAEKVLKSLTVNEVKVSQNFKAEAKLVMAELLHLSLQKNGYPDTHTLVNKIVVPRSAETGADLAMTVDELIERGTIDVDGQLEKAWGRVSPSIVELLKNPERYTGDAIKLAKKEAKNKLVK
ncbi:MAG: hypothetical protein A2174_02440 [Candidatus Portnoybacteria bacterium RBG_13_41_18]|uniref:Fumarate lyase N-terminal domain-containing protein n=1 Tax=Candidatus Portnoybacteria bacterium RBG_13_41_18 TaxID=1801991 RepID=A0A1G2F975_9BACT|nr:MAG: hypothetical protein A2174_02440 [Candidatus Portnoybacteria bacterium RBG_13_41_18]